MLERRPSRCWFLAHEMHRRDGTGTAANATGVAPATRQINMLAASHQSRYASIALVAVVAADVDPLQSMPRPHPAPAVIVGGVAVVVGRAEECKAMEAVMEEVVVMAEAVMEREMRKPRRECSRMRDRRTHEMAGAEMRASAHAAEMRGCAHTAEVHASTHAAGTHASTHAAGTHASARATGAHASAHAPAMHASSHAATMPAATSVKGERR